MPSNEISGILCLNKPKSATSHDMVNKIRRLYQTKKVGHTGTLDPLATGVLVILIGRAAKASDFLLAQKKEYIAELLPGYTSDTLDITGNMTVCTDNSIPSAEEIKDILPSFTGEITQIPPMYSAIKHNGKKLYELAREGISIEREERLVTVYGIEYLGAGELNGSHRIRIECSKGTYIRTLCDDIGRALGCGAVMSSLCRTKNADFTLEASVTIEELEVMSYEERCLRLLPTESAFSDLEKVCLPPFFERLARSGNEIYLKKIGFSATEGTLIRLCTKDSFFALGRVEGFPDGPAIRPLKQFDI